MRGDIDMDNLYDDQGWGGRGTDAPTQWYPKPEGNLIPPGYSSYVNETLRSSAVPSHLRSAKHTRSRKRNLFLAATAIVSMVLAVALVLRFLPRDPATVAKHRPPACAVLNGIETKLRSAGVDSATVAAGKLSTVLTASYAVSLENRLDRASRMQHSADAQANVAILATMVASASLERDLGSPAQTAAAWHGFVTGLNRETRQC